MIKILIADDHALIRAALRSLLAGHDDMTVVAQAATGAETLERAKEARPDVVLLDIAMPGRGGIEIAQELKRLHPGLRVLMLTALPEDHYAVRCLKGGADGYLTKTEAPEVLNEAIRRVASGRKFVTPSLAEQLALALDEGAERPSHEALSDREFQVLLLIGGGKTVSEIARDLCLSVRTVSTYRSRILEKMRLKNNAEIMRYVVSEGLVH